MRDMQEVRKESGTKYKTTTYKCGDE